MASRKVKEPSVVKDAHTGRGRRLESLGASVEIYKSDYRYDDTRTDGLRSVWHWPVTVVYATYDEGESVTEWHGENTIRRTIYTKRLIEFSNVDEAKACLEQEGYEPTGKRVCGYHLAYRSDKGMARILFAPACVYEEWERDRLEQAMDRMEREARVREEVRKRNAHPEAHFVDL